MDNKEITDKHIKNLLLQAEAPKTSIDLEEIIMQNLPNERPIKKQMLQCYRRIRLGMLMMLLSFFGFLLWMLFEIQDNQSIAFFEKDDPLSHLLLTILIWFVLLEVLHKAKRSAMRMELVG